MREVLHELVDAVAALKGITGSRQAELHAKLDQAPEAPAAVPEPEPERARGPFEPKLKDEPEPEAADVPAGA